MLSSCHFLATKLCAEASELNRYRAGKQSLIVSRVILTKNGSLLGDLRMPRRLELRLRVRCAGVKPSGCRLASPSFG